MSGSAIAPQVKELRAAGYTVAEIARAVGATQRSVRDAVSRMIDTGEVPPCVEPWTAADEQILIFMADQGSNDQAIAEATGRTVLAVHRKRTRLGHKKRKPWTPEEDEQLAELVASRKRDSEIAAALGRPVWGVIARRRSLDLQRKKMTTPESPRNSDGRWKKGACPNPGGKSLAHRELVELARTHGPDTIARLVEIRDTAKEGSVQVAACQQLLDRGYGKPSQAVQLTGEDGGPVQTEIVIRKLFTPIGDGDEQPGA